MKPSLTMERENRTRSMNSEPNSGYRERSSREKSDEGECGTFTGGKRIRNI